MAATSNMHAAQHPPSDATHVAQPAHPRVAALVEVLRTVGLSFLAWLVAMTAVMSAIGLLLTHVLDHTAIVRFDERFAHTLADGRTHTLDRLTGMGTFIADPIPVATLWLLLVIAATIATRNWVAPAFPMIAIGGEKLSYFFTTLVVRRPRPDVPTLGQLHVTSSFPSGHVGSAISVYGSIALLLLWWFRRSSLRWRIPAGVIVALLAAIVGASRLYRGHHFVTDVIVGAMVGVTWLLIAHHLLWHCLPERERRGEDAAA
ncbi:MAG TPA: phosphatase PAP2 family protein [Acidimicrobiales bacterium]|nr:phosphatase PAP2 family protein [Acidimicrobiales bacterium]